MPLVKIVNKCVLDGKILPDSLITVRWRTNKSFVRKLLQGNFVEEKLITFCLGVVRYLCKFLRLPFQKYGKESP